MVRLSEQVRAALSAASDHALPAADRAEMLMAIAIGLQHLRRQNNLATASRSNPVTDERRRLREALAVQAFEGGLEIVSRVDHPIEYAMLHNNLGNALPDASSGHVTENNLRALDACDEALEVRTRDATPFKYANTIANKANCLWNVADAAAVHLRHARACCGEAREIFAAHRERERACAVGQSCEPIDRELLAGAPPLTGAPCAP